MAQLMVRNVEAVVRELKKRAARAITARNRSIEKFSSSVVAPLAPLASGGTRGDARRRRRCRLRTPPDQPAGVTTAYAAIESIRAVSPSACSGLELPVRCAPHFASPMRVNGQTRCSNRCNGGSAGGVHHVGVEVAKGAIRREQYSAVGTPGRFEIRR